MLISSSAGLLTALAVIAKSVAIPAQAPQQVDVCSLGLDVTIGAPKNTHNGPFNIRVSPNTTVTRSSPLGYTQPEAQAHVLVLRRKATTFNLTNDLLTAVINGDECEAQEADRVFMDIPRAPRYSPPLQVFEQQQCVDNAAVNVLTAKGYAFNIVNDGQGNKFLAWAKAGYLLGHR